MAQDTVFNPLGSTVDGSELVIASEAQGDVLYHNGTNWVRLGAGTSGQFLQTLGVSANPAWADNSGWTLLETLQYTSYQTSFDFTPDLTDYKSIMIVYIMLKGSSAGTMSLRLNGAITAGNRQTLTASSTTISGARDTSTDIFTISNGTDASGTCIISNCNADSGRERHAIVNIARDITTAIQVNHCAFYISTPAKATVITSAGIESSVASKLAGTFLLFGAK